MASFSSWCPGSKISRREVLGHDNGVTTRRGFLKAGGIAAIVVAGVAANLTSVPHALAADPAWATIPPQDWAVGVPVYLDLADYCTDPDGDPLIFELDQPLPPGITLSGSVISGTPQVEFMTTQIVATADDQGVLTSVPSDVSPRSGQPRLVAWPNPTGGAVRFLGERKSTLESSGTLRIFAVSGRMVYERAIRVGGGHYNIEWDGRTSDGTSLASGVYVATVQTGPETARTRVVLAH